MEFPREAIHRQQNLHLADLFLSQLKYVEILDHSAFNVERWKLIRKVLGIKGKCSLSSLLS